MLIPVVEAGFGHSLAEAALLEEVFFEATDLLVEEVVGLMNAADGDVGEGLRRASVDVGAIELKGGLALLPETSSSWLCSLTLLIGGQGGPRSFQEPHRRKCRGKMPSGDAQKNGPDAAGSLPSIW